MYIILIIRTRASPVAPVGVNSRNWLTNQSLASKIPKHFSLLLLGLHPSLDPLRRFPARFHNDLKTLTFPDFCYFFAHFPYNWPTYVTSSFRNLPNNVYLITFYLRLKFGLNTVSGSGSNIPNTSKNRPFWPGFFYQCPVSGQLPGQLIP